MAREIYHSSRKVHQDRLCARSVTWSTYGDIHMHLTTTVNIAAKRDERDYYGKMAGWIVSCWLNLTKNKTRHRVSYG